MQPFKVGVTVMFAVCTLVAEAVAARLILPVPLAERPIVGLSFVQLNVVPDWFPPKLTVNG